MKDTVKSIISEFLRPLRYLWMLCALAIISFPFVWIWYSYYYAWRISLSGLIAIIIVSLVYNVLKKLSTSIIKNEINKPDIRPNKSKFHQRMEEMKSNINN